LIARAVKCFERVIALNAPDTPCARKARQALDTMCTHTAAGS
jgi:hypothetical protein